MKNDLKFYLSSFLAVVFFAALPEIILYFTPPTFTIDFMYEVYYYLIFFILFFTTLLFFFFGWKKNEFKNRKIFLIYYCLLFLIACFSVAYWLGWIINMIFKAPWNIG
jgi:cytochrome bd-type quinol oxidase subunit 1